MANRFYIYNYCWENFVHYDIKKDNETNEFVQDGDPTSMMYHKIGSNHCVPVYYRCSASVVSGGIRKNGPKVSISVDGSVDTADALL